jgi:SagB-type dehydrogenase family enzyme
VTTCLATCLEGRRSTREFGVEPIELGTLSALLGYAAKSHGRGSAPGGANEPDASRTALERFPYPVGGGVNTLVPYVVNRAIEGLAPGFHRYQPCEHRLDLVGQMSWDRFCSVVLDGVDWVERAAFVIVLTAEITRARSHYVNRYQLALMEAGHLAQNILLVAEALDLAACELGAIHEDPLLELLGTPDEHRVPLVAIAIGPRAERP